MSYFAATPQELVQATKAIEQAALAWTARNKAQWVPPRQIPDEYFGPLPRS